MMVFDTNILVYAANRHSEFHDLCRMHLDQARRDPSPAFLTWNICYEFLKVVTHPRTLRSPWNTPAAWRFLDTILGSPGFQLLRPTERHGAVLVQTLSELPYVRGKLLFDLHTAVVMREHGVSRICTRDADFYRFPFLKVVDPAA